MTRRKAAASFAVFLDKVKDLRQQINDAGARVRSLHSELVSLLISRCDSLGGAPLQRPLFLIVAASHDASLELFTGDLPDPRE